MEKKGLIFDIQSFSVHDGPGCRTTVFMNGCPLQCKWCANPESWSRKPHILFSELSCKYEKGCRSCENSCTKKGIHFERDTKPVLNWEICNSCSTFDCAGVCYQNALKICGKEYMVEEIMKILKRDANNWRGNGGVTFSGGDPFAQPEFLLQVLKCCKESGIHTAIETTAFVEKEIFRKVMEYIHFAFIDIKHMDREKHKEKTGVYNDVILENISSLSRSNWNGRLVIRMPVIGGFNEEEENITQLIEFMHLNGLVEINLLPFHRLGESKWTQLGKKYEYASAGEFLEMRLEQIQDRFLEEQIACYIGHDTLF